MSDDKDQKQDDQKQDDQDQQDQIDPKIAELMKDPDAVAALLDKKRGANAEAKKYREELAKLKKTQDDADAKKLIEEGKFKELNESLQGKLDAQAATFKGRAIRSALKLEAIKAGALDPDIVDLISHDDVEIDDDFNVSNAEDVLKAFKEKKPHFFGEVDDDTTPAPPGNRAGLRGKMLDVMPKALQDASPHAKIAAGLGKKK